MQHREGACGTCMLMCVGVFKYNYKYVCMGRVCMHVFMFVCVCVLEGERELGIC